MNKKGIASTMLKCLKLCFSIIPFSQCKSILISFQRPPLSSSTQIYFLCFPELHSRKTSSSSQQPSNSITNVPGTVLSALYAFIILPTLVTGDRDHIASKWRLCFHSLASSLLTLLPFCFQRLLTRGRRSLDGLENGERSYTSLYIKFVFMSLYYFLGEKVHGFNQDIKLLPKIPQNTVNIHLIHPLRINIKHQTCSQSLLSSL